MASCVGCANQYPLGLYDTNLLNQKRHLLKHNQPILLLLAINNLIH